MNTITVKVFPPKSCGLAWFHVPQNGIRVLRPTFPIIPGTRGHHNRDSPFDLIRRRRGHEEDHGRARWLKMFGITKVEKALAMCDMHRDPHAQVRCSFTLEKYGQRRMLASCLHL
jgi:hypothetical protein